jgi:5'-3' exonuclease
MAILLIDALNTLRRTYEALSDHDKMGGIEVVTEAWERTLKIAMNRLQPEYALCVFDGDGPCWRHNEYPSYKANRQPMPIPMRQALVVYRRQLADRLACIDYPNAEADDLIGSLATTAADQRIPVVIMSTDKDFYQLLHLAGVTIYHHFERTFRASEWVISKYGVPPEQFRDFLALMGDASDNVPGVPGVGAKTAARLLTEYGNIEGVLMNIQTIGGKLAEKLTAHQDLLRVSQRLVTLQTDLKLGLRLRDFRVNYAAA